MIGRSNDKDSYTPHARLILPGPLGLGGIVVDQTCPLPIVAVAVAGKAYAC